MGAMEGLMLLTALMLQRSNAANIIPSFAGPYLLHIDRLTPCDGVQLNWTFAFRTSHFNPYKPNEKQTVLGNVTLTETFDDTIWADLRFALRANNEWKRNAFVMRFPQKACSTWRREFPSLFFVVFKGASKTGVCSFPPATHYVNDPVEWVFPSVKVFPYGTYMASLNVGRPGYKQASFCIELYGHFLPKPGA